MNETRTSRREFLTTTGAAGLALTGLSRCAHDSSPIEQYGKRPNLIVLVTDDQRWDAMGCMGNPIIHTPNMDRLADDGVLFTNNFCTTSICMTSRATIFSGLYSRCHGIQSFRQPFTDEAFELTYPMLLREAGYRTGFVGKWGLGGPLPEDQFDFFDGFSGQGQYFHDVNGEEVHLTEILGNKSVRFLNECSPEQPFCLSVSFKAPHVKDGAPDPFQYDPIYADLYSDVEIPEPKTASERHFSMLPDFIRNSEGRTRWERRFANPSLHQHSVKGYYRLITGVDAVVGRILDALQRSGLDENTVILYTSDNGFFLGEHGLAGKWLMYEESIRTPLIIRDPRLPSRLHGLRRPEMTLSVDIARTLLELAGAQIPLSMQGKSLVPLVQGRNPSWRDEWFYDHLYGHGGKIPMSEGIRTERWKYIRYIDQNPVYEELFDLKNDPFEEHNIVPNRRYTAILEQLRERNQAWLQIMRDWNKRWGTES